MKLSLLALLPALFFNVGSPVYANDRLIDAAQQIEAQLGARVGVAIHYTGSDTWWLYNADQRFPMASTFKVLACAALLSSDVADEPSIQVRDLQEYSPVTETLVGQLVSPHELCDATMRTSDNTAANLVLEAIGGPMAVTQFVRGLGDSVTRLDRLEPELNQAIPGDPRDTSTPRAFVELLHKLILGDGLTTQARTTLREWMLSNEVGGPLLRSAIPSDWVIADRTGAGGNGTRGIVAVMWPKDAAPIVAAIFLTETGASIDQRNAAIADLGRIIAQTVSE